MPDDPSTKEKSSKAAGCESARAGLAIMRLGLGTMFLYVFFENLSKGLYSKDGYAGLINYYIEKGHAPGVWKNIMSLAASHAVAAGPLQAVTEVSFGLFLLFRFKARLSEAQVSARSCASYCSSLSKRLFTAAESSDLTTRPVLRDSSARSGVTGCSEKALFMGAPGHFS